MKKTLCRRAWSAAATFLVAGLALGAPLPDPGSAQAGSILPALGEARELNARRPAEISKHYVEVDEGLWIAVHGRRERRQVRYARLPETWSADQLVAAATHGFPVNRRRELSAGRLTEFWSYPGEDLELTFDAGGQLMETHVR